MTGENTEDEHKPAAGSTAEYPFARMENQMQAGFNLLSENIKQLNEKFSSEINQLRGDIQILMNENKEKDDEYQEQVESINKLEEELDKANKKLQEREAIERNLKELKKKYEVMSREHAALQERIKQEKKYKTRVVDWKKEKVDLKKRLNDKGKLIESLKSELKKLSILLKLERK